MKAKGNGGGWFAGVARLRAWIVGRWTEHSRFLAEIESREKERQRWGMRCARAEARVGALEYELGLRETGALPGLTAAEVERLAILAEECGEVAQAIGKVLRHGWESQSPYGGKPNRVALEREIGNVRAVVNLMVDAGDVDMRELQAWQRRKRQELPKWTHHQPDSMPREAQLEMMRSIELERAEWQR